MPLVKKFIDLFFTERPRATQGRGLWNKTYDMNLKKMKQDYMKDKIDPRYEEVKIVVFYEASKE